MKKKVFKVFLAAVALGCFLVFCIVGFINLGVDDTEAYRTALLAIKADPQVQEMTGGFKDVGFLGKSFSLTYNVKTNRGGEGVFDLPVKGQVNDIFVRVKVKQDSLGVWQVEALEIQE
jgi:hypothetical protein